MTHSKDDLDAFASFAQRLAMAARAQTLPRFRNGASVFNKAGPWYDPVTDADREAERAIGEMIAKMYPDHGFIGEEFGSRDGASRFRWVIDPVDGTRAFVCGAPTWTTLIALQYDERPVLGLIDQPYADEIWIGYAGASKFCSGDEEKLAKTSGETDLSRARISTTDPRIDGYMSKAAVEGFAKLAAASRLARFSFDAYAYGLLAIGELDVVAETSLQLHDYAALAPVIEGAGGVVTNWRGDPLGADDQGEILAAATPELHAAAIEALNR
ncbi:MAG: inositol monophosphatase family protein [Pseudomonadota bacterium]